MEEAVLGLGASCAAEGGGLVGAQDEVAELVFLLRDGCGFLLCCLTATDVEIGLALVSAEVQNLEGAEVFMRRLSLTLHVNQPLTCRMNRKFAEIGSYPSSAELLGDGGCCSRSAKEVGDEITLVATRTDDAFHQGFRLLRRVAQCFRGLRINRGDIRPKILSNLTRSLV
jgi:hypothetical protein